MRGTAMERFSEVVGRIYDAGLAEDPAAVDASLTAIRDLIGADQVSLTVQHVHQGWASRRAIGFAADGPRYPARARDNILFHTLLIRHGVGSAQPDHRCVDRATLLRSDYYQAFLRPHAVEHALGLVIRDEAGLVTWLSLNRARAGRAFDAAEMQALDLLHPHLARALRAADLLRRARAERDAALDALDHLRRGLVLLDRRLKPVLVSPHAEAIARGRRCIDLARPGLGLDPAVQRRMRDAVEERAETPRAGFAATVGDAEGSLSLLGIPVRPGPMNPGRAAPEHPGARLALLLHEAEGEYWLEAGHLEGAFGLSAAEAEVTRLAAQGLTTTEIAERRGTRYTTVRSQLSTVLAKVGARNGRELVWKLRAPGPEA